MEIHILYRLKFFVAKNHLSSSLTAVFLAVVLLDHVQYVLLKSLSTQGVWHYACAYALLFRDKLKCVQQKNTPGPDGGIVCTVTPDAFGESV